MPTGHGGLLTRFKDGTETLETFAMMADETREGGPDLPEQISTEDPVKDLIERTFRYYAVYIGFRELLRDRVEFVHTDSEYRPELANRKSALDDYLRQIDKLEEEKKKVAEGRTTPPSVTQAVEELRAKLGIADNINVARAREELELNPPSEERRKELEKYRTEVQAVDLELRKSYVDSQWLQDIESIKSEFSSLISELGIPDVTNLKSNLEDYSNVPTDNPKKRGELRAKFNSLKQALSRIHNKREERLGVARDARLLAIPQPKGIRDLRSALRELNLDSSPERKAKLKSFVDQVEVVMESAKRNTIDSFIGQIASIPLPAGVDSVEHARVLSKSQTR